MLMRVAVGIHKDDIEAAIGTYHLMSERWFTHASPTLFNSGTPRPQLSSCFLVAMKVGGAAWLGRSQGLLVFTADRGVHGLVSFWGGGGLTEDVPRGRGRGMQ